MSFIRNRADDKLCRQEANLGTEQNRSGATLKC